MKPFLLIQSRPEDEASDGEYAAFCRYSGLPESRLERIRIEQQALPEIRLEDYSGIFVGGGPFNFTTTNKSMTQERIEKELLRLLDDVVEADFPFFGACYGTGLLTTHQGGSLSSRYAEPVGPTRIQIVSDDPVLAGVARQFDAFLGHKEACLELPSTATLLASSATCPVQMFRIKQNVYATQFHPELDALGIETRINIYKNHGYFKPEDADKLIALCHRAVVSEPMKLLQNFVDIYG
jgi:GMP synthase (glutamine-hydrolysing)